VYNRAWEGAIDEIKIWNRPLSAAEIQELYSEKPVTIISTTQYYDNRNAVVVFSGDDWYGCRDYHEGFMKACDAAQKYKVVFSPGNVPLGSYSLWYTCRAECPNACSVEPDIDILSYNNDTIVVHVKVSVEERNKYGLSYPITYLVVIPENWQNVNVFYKESPNENYVLMEEKTSNDFFNGIDAYRKNLNENKVYISKGFPQETSEFYLKIEGE
jgi:hypothetical protein